MSQWQKRPCRNNLLVARILSVPFIDPIGFLLCEPYCFGVQPDPGSQIEVVAVVIQVLVQLLPGRVAVDVFGKGQVCDSRSISAAIKYGNLLDR